MSRKPMQPVIESPRAAQDDDMGPCNDIAQFWESFQALQEQVRVLRGELNQIRDLAAGDAVAAGVATPPPSGEDATLPETERSPRPRHRYFADKALVGPPKGPPLDIAAWLEKFRRIPATPRAFLHIGNIGNNAYWNAKILNEAGFDCDVLCHDYYHVMGCPGMAGRGHRLPDCRPACTDWTQIDLKGYRRPYWFVQGPLLTCLAYLLAKRQRQRLRQRMLWWVLGGENHTSKAGRGSSLLEQFFPGDAESGRPGVARPCAAVCNGSWP